MTENLTANELFGITFMVIAIGASLVWIGLEISKTVAATKLREKVLKDGLLSKNISTIPFDQEVSMRLIEIDGTDVLLIHCGAGVRGWVVNLAHWRTIQTTEGAHLHHPSDGCRLKHMSLSGTVVGTLRIIHGKISFVMSEP